MFGIIKKMFLILLTKSVSASNHTNCVSLNNKKCEIQPTFINLHSNKYSQELDCYSFAVKLDRCVGSCNNLNNLSNEVCVPNKTENLNLSMFSMIAGINKSKTLKKYISCQCKCKFGGRKCNSDVIHGGITINVDASVKNVMYVKKIMFGILLHVVVKMENI